MRSHVRAAVVGAVVTLAVATGCSGDDAAPAPAPPVEEPSTSTPAPPVFPGGGEDAASDLSSFACEPGPDGVWTATGVITSSAAAVASFEVTVVLAGAAADNPDGRQRVLAEVDPHVPTDFVVPGITASEDLDASCQVQIVRRLHDAVE